MKSKSLQDHLKTIQPLGGKALVKKRGRGYMSKLAKKRWAGKKVGKVKNNK